MKSRDTTASRARAVLTVLTSYPTPRGTTNPYVVQLDRALRAQQELAVENFSWRAALTRRHDVVHLHWPENRLQGRSPMVRTARRAAVLAWLITIRVRGTRIVRTVHNVRPHEGVGRMDRWILRRIDRATRGWVLLQDGTRTPAPQGVRTVIRHGHYRDWYDNTATAPEPGRLLFIGLIRPYKNVPTLIEVFRGTPPSDLTLRVAGRPYDQAMTDQVRTSAGDDARICLRLEFVPDEEIAAELGAAELVVLPFLEMHNSGTALLALSLGRPVLVPRSGSTDDLAAEVGAEWVQRFDGSLDGPQLTAAAAAARRVLATGARPDLSARDWSRTGHEHAEFFRTVQSSRKEFSS